MEFKYSLSILFSNMGYILKILLWILICVLLVASIGAAIMVPIFHTLSIETDVNASVQLVQKDFSDLANPEISSNLVIAAKDICLHSQQALQAISDCPGAMVGLVFASIFLYLLYSFLIGFSHYPVADIVNNIMSSNMRFGLASNMALNFKKAFKYSLSRLAIAFPIDLLFFGVMVGLSIGLFTAIKMVAIPFLMIIGVLLCTFRAMVFAGWLPRLLFHPEEKIFTTFSRSLTFVKRNFKGFFKAYFLTFFCSYLLIAAFSMPTFGIINVLVPAIYYFLLRTIELVGYYKLKGLCFYTDATTVVNTVEFGYREDNQEELIEIENKD